MLNEKKLYYSNGEIGAISVTLCDTVKFIKDEYPDFDVSAHVEDYDEYGCEHFITIKGKCADLVLKKNFGGMYCPANYFKCSVELHCIRDKTTSITHEYKFKNQAPKEITIGENYAVNIKKYLVAHKKFLMPNSSLFNRIDYRNYTDARGVHKYHHCSRPYSWDVVHVSDEDFYVDTVLNLNITTCVKDVDEFFEKIKAQYRHVIKIQDGYILVEGPLEANNNQDDDFFSDNRWTATFVVNSSYPPVMSGNTEQEAIDNLLDAIKQL